VPAGKLLAYEKVSGYRGWFSTRKGLMRKKLYSTQMLADLLKVSTKTIHREREEGKINYIRIVGGKILFRESDVFQYLETLRATEDMAGNQRQYVCQGQ
jgi:excisionase family DNA binding protein